MIRCNFLQSFKKFCERVQSHRQFSKLKRGWSSSSFLSFMLLKLNLKVFLTGCIVAMVTCYAIKITVIVSPMAGVFA